MFEQEVMEVYVFKHGKYITKRMVAMFLYVVVISSIIVCIMKLIVDWKFAQERNAKALLQRILDAQASYNTQNNGSYADSFSRLVDSGILAEKEFSKISKNGESVVLDGYKYTQHDWSATSFKIDAEPINGGSKTFSLDSMGKVTCACRSHMDALEEIQQAQREFKFKNNRFAKSLSELTKDGYLPARRYEGFVKDGDTKKVNCAEVTQVFCKDDSYKIEATKLSEKAVLTERGIVRIN